MANTTTSYDRATLVTGQTSGGVRVPLLVATDGTVQTANGGADNTTVDIDQTTPGTTNGVVINARSVTPTDKGSTITAGGTSQTLAALNTSRKALVIQNPATATENLYVALVGAATVNGSGNYAELVPGGSCTVELDGVVYTGAVTVNAATTAHRYIATEFA